MREMRGSEGKQDEGKEKVRGSEEKQDKGRKSEGK